MHVMTLPRRILIVDDEEMVRKAMARNLSRAGFEVMTAANGAEALSELQQSRPNIVLLDVMMPGDDGFAVLEKIRALHSYADLPIIMSTACDARADILKALRLGANDFAPKPVRIPELLDTIERNLRRDTIDVGDRIANYTVRSHLGQGGAGSVYRCEEDVTGRQVAVKVLTPDLTGDAEFVARFLREAKVAAAISHPNVVSVYGAGRLGSTYFIGLELVDGDDLFNLGARGGLPENEAISIAIDVAKGLQELSKHGIIHRDVKPENILVSKAGQAKITDFGLARPVFSDDNITAQGMAVGTLPYIAPEQLLGKVDKRSDIYALGATLFFALAGHSPFSNDESTSELVKKKFHTPPSPTDVNPRVSAPAAEACQWLMTPEADRRPQNFDEIITRLQALQKRPSVAYVA